MEDGEDNWWKRERDKFLKGRGVRGGSGEKGMRVEEGDGYGWKERKIDKGGRGRGIRVEDREG